MPRSNNNAIAACSLNITNKESLKDWHMGLQKANAVMADLRASPMSCDLASRELAEQINNQGRKVISPEIRRALDMFKKDVDMDPYDRLRRFHAYISILGQEERRQNVESRAYLQGLATSALAQNTLERLRDHVNFQKLNNGTWVIRTGFDMDLVETVLNQGAHGITPQLTSQALRTRNEGIGGHAFMAGQVNTGAQEPLQSSLAGPIRNGEFSIAGLVTQFKEMRQQQNSKTLETAAAAVPQCEPCHLQKEIDELRSSQTQQETTLQALICELMRNLDLRNSDSYPNGAFATQTNEPLPWDVEGLSPANKICLQMQYEQNLKAEQGAKDNSDLMMKTWTEMRAMVAAAGVKEELIKEWWEHDYSWDFYTEEGQCNLFAHIALEKGVGPEAVPDEIMKLIQGTCWAEALIDDARINDFTGKPFMPCAGKELTAEQIAAGIQMCTSRHGIKFGEKKIRA